MRLFSFDSPIKSFGGNMLKLRDHQHTVRYLYLYLGEHRQNANCVSACLHSFQFVCSLLNTKKPPNYSKPCIQAHNSQCEHRTYSDNCYSKKNPLSRCCFCYCFFALHALHLRYLLAHFEVQPMDGTPHFQLLDICQF